MAGPPDLRQLARRIEDAQAEQLERTGRGTSIRAAGGRAVMKGPRSPYSAAIGLGLQGPVTALEVDQVELHLGVAGGPVRVEVTPFADHTLTEELGRRGYALERFHQIWWRAPLPLPASAPFEVREIRDAEQPLWVELFSQAFLGGPTQSDAQRQALLAMPRAEGNAAFLALAEGRPAGVALASAWHGVGLLSAAGVPPTFRGRGLQRALLRARLAWAAERGCDVASSATEVGTASAHVLASCGFLPAYPKVVMVRGG
jgi:GNAT superfamily N-acetyltransferase